MFQVGFFVISADHRREKKAKGESRRAHFDFTSASYFNLRVLHYLSTFIF